LILLLLNIISLGTYLPVGPELLCFFMVSSCAVHSRGGFTVLCRIFPSTMGNYVLYAIGNIL
jgi:membrane protein YqaA with SNARE-associated domain